MAGKQATSVRVDRAERTLQADAETVFAALTDRDAVAAWMPPGNSRGEMHEFDPRPGGAFRMTLYFQDNSSTKRKTTENSDTVDAEFVRVEPNRLLEIAVRFVSDDAAFGGTMSMIWSLQPLGSDQTIVTIEARDVPEGISPEDHANGLAQSLENLANWCAKPTYRPLPE